MESSDYSPLPTMVVFESGERVQTFAVSALDDQEDDAAETITLEFEAPLPTRVERGSPSYDGCDAWELTVPAAASTTTATTTRRWRGGPP